MLASERMDLLERVIGDSARLGLIQRVSEEPEVHGGRVQLDGRDLLNFSSCSYLGLDLDERLIEGAVSAVRMHGVETSASRAYLSSGLYSELEALLEKIFENHVVVAPTTTLGHLSAMPALMSEKDALLLDHQVHSSVQLASQAVQVSGAHVEVIRHNDMDQLEERVMALSETHRFIWYLADGVYSMFGDLSPNRELVAMLDRHPQMRLYVDDAHGMSWAGPRGAGTVMGEVGLHPRMVLTTGMAKGFGPGGGLIVLPDEEQKNRVRTCGPTLIFAGPLQPPILGAAIASAKIHLSPEIDVLQQELRDRMIVCNELLEQARLPVISSPDTPVGFVALGPLNACRSMCGRLIDEGFFTNPAQFPAAPMRRGGARFLLTRHHSFDDIEQLVGAVSKHWDASIRDGGATPEEVWKAFGLEIPESRIAPRTMSESKLILERSESIDKLKAKEWDEMAAHRGCMSTSALALFEQVFGTHDDETQRWSFRYYVIRDRDGEPVLATFFTKALWKADMLAPAEVSVEIERKRENDPLYLTQQVFAQGCLLSEGDHLWLRDPADSAVSREAIGILLEAVRADALQLGCEIRVLRDIFMVDEDLISVYEEDGFMPAEGLASFVIEDTLESDEALIGSLSRRHRIHHRRDVVPFNDHYEVRIVGTEGEALDAKTEERLDLLYQNVKSRNLALNTFDLPAGLFGAMAKAAGWELVLIHEAGRLGDPPVGFFAAFCGQPDYVALIAGLDYEFVEKAGLYRQLIRQIITRARERGQKRVLLGMGAELEKRRVGAVGQPSLVMIEADDSYAFDAVAQVAATMS